MVRELERPMAPGAREGRGAREGGAGSGSANSDDEGGGGIADATSTSPAPSTSSPSPFSRFRPPPARVLLSEASGAVGDLGTFLPLTLGLVAAVELDFGTTLIFTGIYNIITGFVFGVPMPVQPMKTIAAIAVASASSFSGRVTLEEVMAAGMFVSSVVLFLGATTLVDVVNRVVPRSVVAGLQLGVGLKLASSGVKSVFLQQLQGKKKSFWRAPTGVEGWVLGAAALVFLFVSTVARRSKEEEKNTCSPSSASSPPSPSSSFLPGRLQEALLKSKGKKKESRQGGEGEDESSSSGGSSSGGSSIGGDSGRDGGISAAEPSFPALIPSSPPRPPPPPPPPPPAADFAAATVAEEDDENKHYSSSSTWQIPSALLVTAAGVALAFASAPAAALSGLRFGPSKIVAAVPTLQDWGNGITKAGGLAQLPLTTLNSVIAVSHLADSLYGTGGSGGGGGGESSASFRGAPPRDRARWRPSRVAVAVGFYNLLGGWFGAVPACMGSGGLAAQHKFGARGGSAPILLGVFKISLALAFGSSLSSILRFFPSGLLGAMLALAGAELAAAARAGGGGQAGSCCCGEGHAGESGNGSGNSAALTSPRLFALAALTAAAILGLDDPAAGFAVGFGLWAFTEAWERGARFVKRVCRKKRRSSEKNEV